MDCAACGERGAAYAWQGKVYCRECYFELEHGIVWDTPARELSGRWKRLDDLRQGDESRVDGEEREQ